MHLSLPHSCIITRIYLIPEDANFPNAEWFLRITQNFGIYLVNFYLVTLIERHTHDEYNLFHGDRLV